MRPCGFSRQPLASPSYSSYTVRAKRPAFSYIRGFPAPRPAPAPSKYSRYQPRPGPAPGHYAGRFYKQPVNYGQYSGGNHVSGSAQYLDGGDIGYKYDNIGPHWSADNHNIHNNIPHSSSSSSSSTADTAGWPGAGAGLDTLSAPASPAVRHQQDTAQAGESSVSPSSPSSLASAGSIKTTNPGPPQHQPSLDTGERWHQPNLDTGERWSPSFSPSHFIGPVNQTPAAARPEPGGQ